MYLFNFMLNVPDDNFFTALKCPSIVKSLLYKKISQTHHRYPHKRGVDFSKTQDLCCVKDTTKLTKLAKWRNVLTTHTTDKRLIRIPTNQQVKKAEKLNRQRLEKCMSQKRTTNNLQSKLNPSIPQRHSE